MLHLHGLTVFVFREKKNKTKNKMECIIHYFGLKSYSRLKPVSSINEEAILKTKSIHESIGVQNHHQRQCTSIPTPIDKEKHQLHRECYLKFILVNSKNPFKSVEQETLLDHQQEDSASWKTSFYFYWKNKYKPTMFLRHLNFQKILFEKFTSTLNC